MFGDNVRGCGRATGSCGSGSGSRNDTVGSGARESDKNGNIRSAACAPTAKAVGAVTAAGIAATVGAATEGVVAEEMVARVDRNSGDGLYGSKRSGRSSSRRSESDGGGGRCDGGV